ncbi:MAG TPA: diaminopimelate dehydrogenase [Thermoanaerobacterales bacterium]|nr:diaminopimelate dehydrogenase [Thermoanaerobacterales bacterium]
MTKAKVAVVGFGNVGREVLPAIMESPDMEVAGIVLRDPLKIESVKKKVGDIPVVTDVRKLGKIEVAILSIPSRAVPEVAPQYLKMGINTVDSFDIHGDSVIELRRNLDSVAKAYNSVAVMSAGWDPGSDSIVRGLMEVIAPRGLTYINFGPGMSLGHTVAVKTIEGVKDALSMTIPEGTGMHKRLVYVEVKDGYDFEKISEAIKKDPYFINDETHVYKVEDVRALIDKGHGVHMERKGVSGTTHNQKIDFIMSINNPAAAGQVMVAAARASLRQRPGSYAVLEIPLIDFLYGEKEGLLHRLI